MMHKQWTKCTKYVISLFASQILHPRIMGAFRYLLSQWRRKLDQEWKLLSEIFKTRIEQHQDVLLWINVCVCVCLLPHELPMPSLKVPFLLVCLQLKCCPKVST